MFLCGVIAIIIGIALSIAGLYRHLLLSNSEEEAILAKPAVKLADLNNIDHGDTLAEVMDGIAQEDFEITAAFTSDGEKLFEHTDYQDFNVWTDDEYVALLERYHDLIFLHNHPLEAEASFSGDDLAKLAWYNASCGIVVSKSEIYAIMPQRQWFRRWPSPEVFQPYMDQHTDLLHTIACRDVDGKSRQIVTATNELLIQLAAEYDLCYYHWNNTEVSSAEVAAAVLGED